MKQKRENKEKLMIIHKQQQHPSIHNKNTNNKINIRT